MAPVKESIDGEQRKPFSVKKVGLSREKDNRNLLMKSSLQSFKERASTAIARHFPSYALPIKDFMAMDRLYSHEELIKKNSVCKALDLSNNYHLPLVWLNSSLFPTHASSL